MLLRHFPNHRQGNAYECGATVLQVVLAYYGIDARIDRLRKLAETTQRDGTLISGMKKALKHFRVRFTAKRMSLQEVLNHLEHDVPVIVLLQAWTRKKHVDWRTTWDSGHYAVAIGSSNHRICFEDPGSIFRTYLTREEFLDRWHGLEPGGKKFVHFGIAVYGTPHGAPKTVHMD